MNEQYKYQIIKKLVEINGNKKRAAIKLKRSIRQIDRMIAGYKEFGKEFFIHGNRGRKPVKALTEELKTEIELLYTNKYFDCTYTSFKEYLDTRENIHLSIDEIRVIDSGHSIKYKNEYYRLINKVGSTIYFHKGTKCIVIKAFDGGLYAAVDESIYALEKIPEIQLKSENFDEIEETKERKIYIPKMIHPWKGKSFEEFIKTQKHRLKEDVA